MRKLIPMLIILHALILIFSCGSSETILEDLDISKNDTVIKTITNNDTTYKDSTIRDTIYKDTTIQDTIIRDTIIRDTIIRDTIINNIVVVDTFIIPKSYFQNPIIKTSLPDPTVIKADNYYYLYATEDIRNTPIYKSRNLLDWEFVGTAFTNATRPRINAGNVWAPDINYINGQYVLYYSQSVWGQEWSCGIGVAVSDKPEGPFRDLGKLFTSEDIGVRNSIDPFYIEDNCKKYLFWGSGWGIYDIELSDDGLSIKTGAVKQHICGGYMEGTYIHRRNGYYYLFGSTGTCCKGLESSYNVIYGRANNIWGPYVNKDGGKMMDKRYERFLSGNDFVAGPGHNSEFVKDDIGQDWVIYHGYLKSDPDAGRITFIDQVKWTNDNWPYIDNNSPSQNAYKPVIAVY